MSLVDPDGRFLLANDTLTRILRRAKQDLLGRNLADVARGADVERIAAAMARAVEGERPSFTIDVELVRGDGGSAFALLTATLVRDLDGASLYFLVQVQDVTGQKQTQAALAEAEERYRRLLEDLPLVTYAEEIIDGEWAYYLSPQAERILGITPEQYAVMSWDDFYALIHPHDRDRLREEIERFSREPVTSSTSEYRVLAPDGRAVWVRDVAVADRDADGRLARVRGFMLDITEQKQAEAALLGSEMLNRRILASVEEGVVVLDRSRRYLLWNAFMEALQGLSAEEVLGRRPEELSLDLTPTGATDLLERALTGETIVTSRPHEYPQPDGTSRFGEFTLGPLRDESGEITGVIVTVRDVTERIRSELALRRRDDILDAVTVVSRLLVEQPLTECGAQLLAVLGEAVRASRAYLLQIELEGDEHVATDQFEWCGPGVESDAWHALPLERSGLGRWIELFHRNEPVYGPTSTMPPGESLAFERGRVRSLAIVPILLGGALWGAVGFDDCETERAWLPAELDALRAAAAVIGAAISRQRTEQALRDSEEMLRQSQKMEAMGRLAGGVAHDFNNLLTVITGYSGLLLDALAPGEPLRDDVEQIAGAAKRAVRLTSQLLAFSRRQVLQSVPVDVNEIVLEVESMLRRLIGEDIELHVVLGSRLDRVTADPGQLQQVIVNLVVNGRDAMPNGGTLRIETGSLTVTDEGPPLRLPAGEYVWLRVADSGVGMDDETKARVFEPFFTTKENGKGTGLGLATVFGIVKQSRGEILVESAPGLGSTFTVYLPAHATAACGQAPAAEPGEPRGSETILLAEDEEIVRTLVVTVLEQRGYTVLAARDGSEALELAERHAGEIDVLVTDVVMPRMSGRELAERLRAARPTLPVIYISGYADDAFVRRDVPESGAPFLQKPFSADSLATAVREVLDTARAA